MAEEYIVWLLNIDSITFKNYDSNNKQFSARGKKELSIVPQKWVNSTSRGDVLMWPNEKTIAEQEILLRNENTEPKNSWHKSKCLVKRINIASFDEGVKITAEMSGDSSSDISVTSRKKKKCEMQKENFQAMLNLYPNVPFSSVISSSTKFVNTSFSKLPKKSQQFFWILHPHCRRKLQKIRLLHLKWHFQIKHTTNLTYYRYRDVLFRQTQQKMRWLRINISGDYADNRMICALDIIMTKQFQTECTWTGASRKGPKIPLMMYRQILKAFEEIGTSETELVTQQKLANFFMKKLKNANKRLKASGQRRSSRHIVPKKKNECFHDNCASKFSAEFIDHAQIADIDPSIHNQLESLSSLGLSIQNLMTSY
ncbi:uncharacterized protein LOC131434072 [Malaya genurostris]|uniref:uncharacterized protein LOC131434072 n=1 Tax=Malaya genurostris TaxID=325434 RepID=UPI0026F3D26B|nr:uncharacterized protein LOC131434072 [Malaya genurostris]